MFFGVGMGVSAVFDRGFLLNDVSCYCKCSLWCFWVVHNLLQVYLSPGIFGQSLTV